MSAQPAPDTAPRTPEDVLDAVIGAARAGGRSDIADRLSATRRLLGNAPVTVQVTGGTQQDRAALAAVLQRTTSERVTIHIDGADGVPGAGGAALGMAVDVAVLVVPSTQVIGAGELDQLRTLGQRSPRILLALTGTDQHPSWPQVLETDLQHMQAAGISADPFAVSVHQHHRAVADGDPVLATSSGIPAVTRHLDDIADEAAAHATRTVAQDVLNALTELGTPPPPDTPPPPPATTGSRRKATSTATAGTGDRKRASTGSSRRRKGAPADRAPARTRWQTMLSDGMAAAASDVEFDLRARTRNAVADAEHVIDDSDPAHDWDAIETWLRDRLTYEGRQTLALLAERTTAVAGTLEHELGTPLHPPPPPPIPDPFTHLPARPAPTGTRRPLAARSRTLIMSGYGGLMMALILPRLAGVQLPLWIIIATATAATFLMGAAALSGERNRQLDARRTRAKSLVRHYSDGFLLAAGKHTRDTLRNAHQQLRDECTTHTATPRRNTPATPPPPTDLTALRRHALGLLGTPAGPA